MSSRIPGSPSLRLWISRSATAFHSGMRLSCRPQKHRVRESSSPFGGFGGRPDVPWSACRQPLNRGQAIAVHSAWRLARKNKCGNRDARRIAFIRRNDNSSPQAAVDLLNGVSNKRGMGPGFRVPVQERESLVESTEVTPEQLLARRTVAILGEPGSGKSTVAFAMVERVAQPKAGSRSSAASARIPDSLQRFCRTTPPASIVAGESIDGVLATRVLVLDGFDEIRPGSHNRVAQREPAHLSKCTTAAGSSHRPIRLAPQRRASCSVPPCARKSAHRRLSSPVPLFSRRYRGTRTAPRRRWNSKRRDIQLLSSASQTAARRGTGAINDGRTGYQRRRPTPPTHPFMGNPLPSSCMTRAAAGRFSRPFNRRLTRRRSEQALLHGNIDQPFKKAACRSFWESGRPTRRRRRNSPNIASGLDCQNCNRSRMAIARATSRRGASPSITEPDDDSDKRDATNRRASSGRGRSATGSVRPRCMAGRGQHLRAFEIERDTRLRNTQATPFDEILRRLRRATSLGLFKVWCEGPTDAPTIHAFVAKLPLANRLDVVTDSLKGWTAVMNPAWPAERLGDGCHDLIVILDGDKARDWNQPGHPFRRDARAVLDKLTAAGIDFVVLERYGIENYFHSDSV